MKRILFNATQPDELRVAIVKGGDLIYLDVESSWRRQRKGNIYKAVISRIQLNLEACFVDYGAGRHGFLSFRDIHPSYLRVRTINEKVRYKEALHEGMELMVQVERDERGTKGAGLSTYISLAGRYLVLMPNNPKALGVSRKIDVNQRSELREVISKLGLPEGMSLIARTAVLGQSLSELRDDLGYLLKLWGSIKDCARASRAPTLIFQEPSLVIRTIRDYYQSDVEEVLVDHPEYFEQARSFVSEVINDDVSKVKFFDKRIPIFSFFRIEEQIEEINCRVVPLPSGGSLVIDHTEALVAIDVNSARSNKGEDVEIAAFLTNLEAAEEVAKQLKLRDLGGLIVVDFIDMIQEKNQRELENRMREFLRMDRAKVQVSRLSRFGLMEISRQRLQTSFMDSIYCTCRTCNGSGLIRNIESTARHILRRVENEITKQYAPKVQIQLPVDVATFMLNEQRGEIVSVENRLGVEIIVVPNRHIENPTFFIKFLDEMDVKQSYASVLKPEVESNVKVQPVQQKPILEDKEKLKTNDATKMGFWSWIKRKFN